MEIKSSPPFIFVSLFTTLCMFCVLYPIISWITWDLTRFFDWILLIPTDESVRGFFLMVFILKLIVDLSIWKSNKKAKI